MPLVDSLNIKVLQVLQHSQDYITHQRGMLARRWRVGAGSNFKLSKSGELFSQWINNLGTVRFRDSVVFILDQYLELEPPLENPTSRRVKFCSFPYWFAGTHIDLQME